MDIGRHVKLAVFPRQSPAAYAVHPMFPHKTIEQSRAKITQTDPRAQPAPQVIERLLLTEHILFLPFSKGYPALSFLSMQLLDSNIPSQFIRVQKPVYIDQIINVKSYNKLHRILVY